MIRAGPGVGRQLPTVTRAAAVDPEDMLKRSPVAVLFALTACVTGADEPTDDAPFHGPTADVGAPVFDDVIDQMPLTPPTWRNHRPTPGIDQLATLEDVAVKVSIDDLLANDHDPDGGRVVFAGLGTISGGTATVVGRNVVFAPAPDFNGLAWFDYVVSDGRLQAAGRARVTVTPVNDAPIAYGARFDVMAGDDLTFRIDAFDPDGDSLALDLLAVPTHGTLDGDGGKYRYAPDPSWSGVDHLTYRAGDDDTWSEPVTIDLVVTARE